MLFRSRGFGTLTESLGGAVGSVGASFCPSLTPGATVTPQPQLSADTLLAQLRGDFEKLCQDVADAVNQAPAGQVLNASEDKVRDLLAAFRQAAYQAAIQLRLDAAQAAFPPSGPPRDGQAPAEQGP